MTTAIVYQGAGGGGNLFEGLKFHILQRVPARHRWKDLVIENGGEHVPLERQADIVIADHARKNAPAGSISWTFIEQSVKNGMREDIENHRAGPEEQPIREAGSARPAKTGRTPFTHEDDRILMEWCMRAEAKGVPLMGNELYKQLEQKNPRHTFQAWRHRWVKYLSTRPRTALNINSEEEEEADDIEEATSNPPVETPTTPSSSKRPTAPRPNHTNPKPIAKVSTTRAVVRSSPARSAISQAPYMSISTGGTTFTNEETHLLLDAYDDIMNLDEDRLIDAWIAWAVAYPNHTAQEWRNFFNKSIKGKRKPEKLTQTQSGSTSREIEPGKTPEDAPLPARPNSVHALRSPDRVPPSAPILEVKDSQGSSGQTLQSSRPEDQPATQIQIDETVFQEAFTDIANAKGLEVDFNVIIYGQRISLYRLWQVVVSDEFGGFDQVNEFNKWSQVARALNFNDFRHPNAAEDLRDCYSEVLADLESLLDAFQSTNQEISVTASEEEAMIESQLRQTALQGSERPKEDEDSEMPSDADDINGAENAGDDEYDDDLDYPQSSSIVRTPISLAKRRFESDNSNVPDSFDKRQRIEKGKGRELEIPSTPEHATKQSPLRSPNQRSSLMKGHIEFVEDAESSSSSSSSGLFVKPTKLTLKPSSKGSLESKTQDFLFAPEEDTGFAEAIASPLRNPHRAQERRIVDSANASQGRGPSPNDSSTQSQTESQQEKLAREFVERYMALSYPQAIIAEALEATTMVLEDAPFVMEALMNGRGIPDDIPGVWTLKDDEALESRDQGTETEEYRRVMLKHGKARLRIRKRYLRDLNEVREENK